MLVGLALPPILDLGGGLELAAQAQQQLHLVVLPLLRRVALPRVQVLFEDSGLR
jgi:hypothetical protein